MLQSARSSTRTQL